jgi:hypothetical protein
MNGVLQQLPHRKKGGTNIAVRAGRPVTQLVLLNLCCSTSGTTARTSVGEPTLVYQQPITVDQLPCNKLRLTVLWIYASPLLRFLEETFPQACANRGDHIREINFKAQMDHDYSHKREKVLSWRHALLVGTSALLSGIAVVIWNRRALQKMRESAGSAQPVGGTGESSQSEEEFI